MGKGCKLKCTGKVTYWDHVCPLGLMAADLSSGCRWSHCLTCPTADLPHAPCWHSGYLVLSLCHLRGQSRHSVTTGDVPITFFFCKQVWVTWFWGCASRVPINQPCIRGGNKRVLPNCLNLLSFEQNYPNTNMTTSIAESFIKCHIEPIFHQCRLQICVSIKLADSKA